MSIEVVDVVDVFRPFSEGVVEVVDVFRSVAVSDQRISVDVVDVVDVSQRAHVRLQGFHP